MQIDSPIDISRKLSKVSDLVLQKYRGFSLTERPRHYIGASIAGHKCDRFLWLSLHWAFYYQMPEEGRMELLFKRGQREEEYVKHNLEIIGLNPKYMLWQQKDINLGGHVKCHPDGIIPGGIPEAPKSPHNLEIKTHNDRSFRALKEKGVKESKPMHYIQMQIEMYAEKYIDKEYSVERSLYYAVNKNTDDIYTERIELKKEEAEIAIRRCQRIALEKDLPIIKNFTKKTEPCIFCKYSQFCYAYKDDRMLPEINCRTCAYCYARSDDCFFCSFYEDTVPLDFQYKGCKNHVFIPSLVPDWTYTKESNNDCPNALRYTIPELDGEQIWNGENGTESEEILRKILKNRKQEDDYLAYKNRTPAVPDPNDIISF